MASNDNQMTRFLFAILKQKSLKDIDWNQVAHDPILAQPITNGHAARMRYSRFRSAMLGLEPQKRNRNGPSKSKLAKSKKDGKSKKEDDVKPEPDIEAVPDRIGDGSAIGIKQEPGPAAYQSQFTPTSIASPPFPDCHSTINAGRLLTPCSDDMVSTAHLAMSPSNDMFDTASQFSLSTAGQDFGHIHGQTATHEAWAHSPGYATAFDAAFDMGQYDGTLCEHQHLQTHSAELHDHDADALGELDDPQAIIKHEDLGQQLCLH